MNGRYLRVPIAYYPFRILEKHTVSGVRRVSTV
jgi:hypothetical protein